MARKKGAFRKYLRGAISMDFSLGTLASKDTVTIDNTDSVVEKAWVSSVKATWSMASYTPTVGVGPIVVGVAHSDYTATEIEEWLENTGSWEEASQVSQEIAKRKIRIVGTFEVPAASTETIPLNDGMQITTKCGWMLRTGQTVRYWAYNRGTAAIATTVPIVNIEGHANLWPR